MKANLIEVMESIQGEGSLLGSRQIFVRFAGCNLSCTYCDTPESLNSGLCRVSPITGSNVDSFYLANPLSVDQVIELIGTYTSRWVSLTGGEPLLWADFIAELAPRLRSLGYEILLETNGILHHQLDLCLPYINVISMDIKTCSATGNNYMNEHALFLAKAARKQVYVKIVIEAVVDEIEIEAAAALIKSIDADVTLILQPVSPRNDIAAPTMDRLLVLQQTCLNYLHDVRIIPQVHKILKVT